MSNDNEHPQFYMKALDLMEPTNVDGVRLKLEIDAMRACRLQQEPEILKKCTHFEWIDEYVQRIKSEGYIDSSVAATWELNLGGVPQMENWGSSDRGAGRVVPMARYLESELTDELKKIKKNQREMIDMQKQANIMAVFSYCCVIALFMFYLLFIVIRGGI
ncbi:hypothetical protein D1007_19430 [Hordeum vulgare]|nr:hypothetical protein D1007_19430 [Hordeum vulgare]